MTQVALFNSHVSMQALLLSLPPATWHECAWEPCGPVTSDGVSSEQPVRCAGCGALGVQSVNLALGQRKDAA